MKRKPIPPPNLWELLDADYKQRVRPNGVFTIGEYADRYGCTYSMAEGAIARLVKAKKLALVGRYGPRHEKCYGVAS